MPTKRSFNRKRGVGRLILGAAFGVVLLSGTPGVAGAGKTGNRKVISRTNPSYPELAKRGHLSGPELAKRGHLSGKVKVELVIAASGSVKSVRLVGGNPVFEQSALDAAKQWKFEASEAETKAVILIEFSER
jgi:TonB family protein